ncbi:MAG: AMP-binding protein [Mycolicibacterium sp.]|nr:AMP-binding protein [Mycolicibacterium sp.]
MHFAMLPDQRAAQNPDGPALADESSGRLTNQQLSARVQTAADRLAAAGVRPGDVVAVMLPNRVELIITLFAAWRLRAAATPINPALTATEVEYQLADSSARVLICDDNSTAQVPVIGLAELSQPSATPVPAIDHCDDDLALLIYTSGTTGRPKGVELTHANIMAMAQSTVPWMKMDAEAHSLLILPLFHVNGIVVSVLSPLLAGGQATVAGRFRTSTFFEIVEKVRPTYFSAVPAIYAMLTALPDRAVPDVSSLRFAICGAAPMPVELIERFEQRYGVPIVEGYGLSEATCASTCNPVDGLRKPGTAGVALPGLTVAVMNEHGDRLPQGAAGEVVVKGPTVMRGYLNRPEETARTIIGGWLHTGDIGVLDEDGYLTLVDRAKDMIIRGGENIYPKEIESVMYTHPGVLEAAVVGRPDPVYGEVPVAFVSLRDGADTTAGELLDHLTKSLSRYKLPADIRTLPGIPKNPVGKIDKPALRRQLAALAPV